jgi:hypothetical protein
MKIKRLVIALFVGTLMVTSCNWGPNALDETRDQILTAAYKQDTVNFAQFQSYAITDSVTVIYHRKKFRVSNDTTSQIIAQVVQNMNKNGYTQVETTDNPNLLVDISYIQRTNTVVYAGSWNDWDWWWNSYYYPWSGWYSYYPYYIPTYASSYTTGSLVIELANMTNVSTNKNIPIVWHGVIREILNGDHTQSELIASINEVFTILPPK